MAANLERKILGIVFKQIHIKLYQDHYLKRADPESVIRLAIRRSVIELQVDTGTLERRARWGGEQAPLLSFAKLGELGKVPFS